MNSLPFLSVLCAATTSSLFANGGGYLQGIKSTGPFRPVNVESVEMVSEKLDIELKQGAALISITYQLHNPGKAVKVEMGFPCSVAVKMEYNDGKAAPVESLPQLEGFSLTADGKAVESKLVEDHATLPAGKEQETALGVITGWQVVKLQFAAGQTRTVSVSYRNPYFRDVSYMSRKTDKSAPAMRYLFSAAALWKGVIKSGEVTVRATGIKPDDVILSHPKRFKRDGSQWIWTFTDFEPTMQDDLQIVVGEHEFFQFPSGSGDEPGTYIMRGRTGDRAELQRSGKWFFLSRQFTTTASSSLKADANRVGDLANPHFNPGFHSDLPWVEGAEGDGIGESLTLTINQPVKATRLLIHNGYRKSKEVFQMNNRVKKLGVSVNGGAPFSAELPDEYDSEGWVDLPPDAGPVKTLNLAIEDVYRGTKFRDTCINFVEVEVPLSKAPVIKPSR
jgi:Domain of unknown function (DUF4424)